MSKVYTATYRGSTVEEMVDSFQQELNRTPKWKFLKRLSLKRSIECWGKL